MNRCLAALCAALAAWPAFAAAPAIPPGAGFNNANSNPGISNLTPLNLSNWRKCKGLVRAGQGSCVVLEVGDSTTRGEHSSPTGGSPNDNGAIYYAHSARVAAALSSLGLSVNTESILGGSNYSQTNLLASDPRLGMGSSWSLFNSSQTAGGQFFQASTSTNSLSFTPLSSVDTVKICYAQGTGNGTFTYNVDGGSTLATINSNGANAYICSTSTVSLAAHTINVNEVSGNVFIGSIQAWNSTVSQVRYLNAGWGGSTAANWNQSTAGYNPFPTIAAIAPTLTIINLGINDWVTGVSASSFQASLHTLVVQARLSGDVVLCVPAPSSTSSASAANQAAIVSAIYAEAANDNVPVVDWTYRFGSYTAANALGEYWDVLHPNYIGQADMADPLIRVLWGP